MTAQSADMRRALISDFCIKSGLTVIELHAIQQYLLGFYLVMFSSSLLKIVLLHFPLLALMLFGVSRSGSRQEFFDIGRYQTANAYVASVVHSYTLRIPTETNYSCSF